MGVSNSGSAHLQAEAIPCVSPVVQDLEEVLSKDVSPPYSVHESVVKKAVGHQQVITFTL